MAETDGTRQPNDTPGHRSGKGLGRWFYGGMAVLAVAGAALVVGALRPTSDESAAQNPDATGTTETTGATAATGTAEAAGTSAAAAQNATRQAEFPAAFDTLGVSIGPDDAPLVIREFADYQCPACGAFAPTTKRIRDEYVASGEVRFVLFDIPLTNIHPNALVSAQAARCAGKQGDYWAMHDALFENQNEWSPASEPLGHFTAYAADIGLDAGELQRCVESEETREAVERSHAFAIGIGVRSTPSMLVGNVPIVGSLPYERVRGLIEEQLAAK